MASKKWLDGRISNKKAELIKGGFEEQKLMLKTSVYIRKYLLLFLPTIMEDVEHGVQRKMWEILSPNGLWIPLNHGRKGRFDTCIPGTNSNRTPFPSAPRFTTRSQRLGGSAGSAHRKITPVKAIYHGNLRYPTPINSRPY